MITSAGILGGGITGTFKATAATQGFNISVVRGGCQSWSGGNQAYNLNNPINALVLAVPEPASLSLLCLGGLLALGRRRPPA